MKGLQILVLCGLIASSCAPKKEHKEENKKPNIIYILADDLGYGDLSSYGQQKFSTPNIDKMVANGMKFSQHYSGTSVCAPSRSSLMTGQHTGHTPIRGNKELDVEGQQPIKGSAITIPKVLKKAGYVTGAFGKWGLGFIDTEGDPTNQGFDEFFGYNCQRMSHRYYPTHVWHNKEKIILEGNDWAHKVVYAPDLIQKKTLEFLEMNKDKQFFAYVPIILPHAEMLAPEDPIFEKYKGKFPETPHTVDSDNYTSDYGPNLVPKHYCPQPTPHAAFAAMVDRLDTYVGQIVAKVNELGIADNTIIMFASDNGPHAEGGADPEFFNSTGGLKGIKRDLYEGGIRSPFVAVWPGKIKAGATSNHISAFWDIMPTLADLAGVPNSKESDGISLLPTLLGKETQVQHEYLYWEFHGRGGRQAARKGKWKAVAYNIENEKKASFELFNLDEDPFETTNIAKENLEVVLEMKKIINEAHVESEIFPFEI
ncbi:arylsulfatase [Flavicella sediminum]|uniref:arylsulfatase n=1 Tax=Flavicella sediminum TaxID=2585141 RepID=UPI001120AB2D|nr:arylsulfatase [Flavicella sediminum]